MLNDFKCRNEQLVDYKSNQLKIKACAYRSSAENRLEAGLIDTRLLRFYEVRINDSASAILLNEIELRYLLGDEKFDALT